MTAPRTSRAGCFVKSITSIAVLLIAGVLAIDCAGRARLNAEEEALSATNEPLEFAELDLPEIRSGSPVEPWINSLGDVQPPLPTLFRALDFDGLDRMPGLDDEMRARLRELRACAVGTSADDFNRELRRLLEAGTSREGYTDCQWLALTIERDKIRALFPKLLDACEYGGLDFEAIVQTLPAPGQSYPAGAAFRLLALARNCVQAAPVEALSGEPERALEIVKASLCAIESCSTVPFAGVHQTRLTALIHALRALEGIVPLLPQGTDLSEIRETLERWDVISESVLSLQVERIVRRDYFSDPELHLGLAMPRRLRWSRRFDEAEFLEWIREEIEALKNRRSTNPRPASGFPPVPITRFLTQDLGRLGGITREVDERRTRVLALIDAR